MIKYVDDYVENNTLLDDFGEGGLMISAENQCWDKQTLKQLRDEYDIIFMSEGDGATPIKVVKYGKHYGIALGSEDDGTMFFEKYFDNYKHMFSEYWIDSLIADLHEAKKHIAKLKETEVK